LGDVLDSKGNDLTVLVAIKALVVDVDAGVMCPKVVARWHFIRVRLRFEIVIEQRDIFPGSHFFRHKPVLLSHE
jgi:hypothetical protein